MAAISKILNPVMEATRRERPLVVLRGMSKRFLGGTVALRSVNLELRTGEFVSLLGPSGCGKSTLLRIIAGLTSPSSGEVDWPTSTYSASGDPEPDLGFVFQDPTLLPWETAIRNVMLPLVLSGVRKKDAEARASEFVELVGLKGFERAYPRELSGGMRMRSSRLPELSSRSRKSC